MSMGSVMTLPAGRHETEVSTKAKRRRFTAEYKARVLREVESCTQAGEIGALLRREGLYSSHLTKWRVQAEQGRREQYGRGGTRLGGRAGGVGGDDLAPVVPRRPRDHGACRGARDWRPRRSHERETPAT